MNNRWIAIPLIAMTGAMASGSELPTTKLSARDAQVIRRDDLLSVGDGSGFSCLGYDVGFVRVDDQGGVRLPLIGSVEVEGLTEAGAARKVAQRLREANLIQNAQVSVVISNDSPTASTPSTRSAP
jgi:protein involved in polysaccharide export with SLBB domain